jgi:YTH domain-containing family protein
VSKGVVLSPNPPALSVEPWAQQDYKDAAMYYGYPGAYYCGGEASPSSLLYARF